MFSIISESDTGFFDAQSDVETDVSSFSSVEESQTQLIFLSGLNCEWTDFRTDFEEKPWPIFTANAPEYVRKKGKRILVAKIFPLSRFVNQEETLLCLKEWQEFCVSNGIKEMKLV